MVPSREIVGVVIIIIVIPTFSPQSPCRESIRELTDKANILCIDDPPVKNANTARLGKVQYGWFSFC